MGRYFRCRDVHDVVFSVSFFSSPGEILIEAQRVLLGVFEKGFCVCRGG